MVKFNQRPQTNAHDASLLLSSMGTDRWGDSLMPCSDAAFATQVSGAPLPRKCPLRQSPDPGYLQRKQRARQRCRGQLLGAQPH